LRRAADGHIRPCIFNWNPNTQGFLELGFILLHVTADSTKKVELDTTGLVTVPKQITPLVVGSGQQFFWELSPECEITFVATLPERYHKILVPGENYQLVWPGGDIDFWDWGTISDHANQELRPRSIDEVPQKPRLVLPGASSNSFQVEEELDPWPMRAAREARVGFMVANDEEQRWRARQEKKRREEQERPSSPLPIAASERMQVYVLPIARNRSNCLLNYFLFHRLIEYYTSMVIANT
jgi:hypothetical protein